MSTMPVELRASAGGGRDRSWVGRCCRLQILWSRYDIYTLIDGSGKFAGLPMAFLCNKRGRMNDSAGRVDEYCFDMRNDKTDAEPAVVRCRRALPGSAHTVAPMSADRCARIAPVLAARLQSSVKNDNQPEVAYNPWQCGSSAASCNAASPPSR